jgi:pSer/pThr/pTyr-binding forkhead associated (FHA) protein
MNANLVLLKKDGAHRAFPLTSGVAVIGRRHDCDLRVPVPTVSRKHCQLSQNGDSLEIRDLDSKAGTFVNNRRVDGKTSLKAGDYIRIGPLTFVCQIDGKPEKVTAPPPAKTAAKPSDQVMEDSFADLDASDSFIQLDESDSELDDLKDL